MRQYRFIEKHETIKSIPRFIALDLETTGLNPRQDTVVGFSYSFDGKKAVYSTDWDFLARVVQNEKLVKIFHNAVFDISFLKARGLEIKGQIHDTMILAHSFNPDYTSYKLKDMAKACLGDYAVRSAKVMYQWLADNQLDKEDIAKAPQDILTNYAAEDAASTFELFEFFCGKMRKMHRWLKEHDHKKTPWDYYMEEQMPMVPVIIDMQMTGVSLDTQKVAEEANNIKQRIRILDAELREELKDVVNRAEDILHKRKIAHRIKRNKTGKIKKVPPRVTLNWDSNDHLQLIILKMFKIKATKRTKKGNPSIDAEYLESLQERLPWIAKLLEYKDLRKALSMYFENKQTKKGKKPTELLQIQEGGVIHASFNITGTATGRLSSNNPNLQNLPKHGRIKELFVPRAGHKFIYADYNQLELRIAAHLTHDKLLCEAYRNNTDLHQQTASLLGIERDSGKRLNFAIIYNASGWKVAEIMGWLKDIPPCDKGWKCECAACEKRREAVKKGDALREKLFGKYAGIKKYLDKQESDMLRYKLAISEFGRIRRLDDIDGEDKKKHNHAIKAGFNLGIQSFGASLCKRSMIELRKKGFKVLNQIHDSIVIEAYDADVEDTIKDVKTVMESIYQLRVPLIADPKILTSFQDKEH